MPSSKERSEQLIQKIESRISPYEKINDLVDELRKKLSVKEPGLGAADIDAEITAVDPGEAERLGNNVAAAVAGEETVPVGLEEPSIAADADLAAAADDPLEAAQQPNSLDSALAAAEKAKAEAIAGLRKASQITEADVEAVIVEEAARLEAGVIAAEKAVAEEESDEDNIAKAVKDLDLAYQNFFGFAVLEALSPEGIVEFYNNRTISQDALEGIIDKYPILWRHIVSEELDKLTDFEFSKDFLEKHPEIDRIIHARSLQDDSLL